MPTHKLTPEIINAAIVGFEQQKLRIDAQIAELRAILDVGHTEPVAAPDVPKGKRRKMSAAGRAAIVAALKKRWAAKKAAAAAVPVVAKKPAVKKAAVKKVVAKKAARKTATKKAAQGPVQSAKEPTA